MMTQLASRDEPPSDMKGVVRPVSGMTRVTPPMTMNSWKATEKVRPMASSLPKPSRTPSAVRMPRSTEDEVEHDDARPSRRGRAPRRGSVKMKSLSAKDVSQGRPAPRPVPVRPPEAIPHRPLASWLERSRLSGREGVEPEVDALLEVRERRQGEGDGDAEEQQADGDPGHPLGGDVEHRDEEAEEEQRRAEVLLEDEDEQREHPRDEDRAEVAAAREGEAEDPLAGEREHVAGLHEVAGEEDREGDLGELARLEVERPEADPDLRAVDRPADDRARAAAAAGRSRRPSTRRCSGAAAGGRAARDDGDGERDGERRSR